ncbi:MAG: hypothetical protein ACTS9Y_13395 [Methylophilus sp.]|uniref:hypothetical protein n=1 Tax=Methylophilus sp. TaxID=29541 RepID=UPI003FA17CA1
MIIGGKSKSSSASAETNADNRIVADAEAQAASSGSQVAKDYASPVNINVVGTGMNKSSMNVNSYVTMTDHGAIAASFNFAENALDKMDETVEEVLGVAKSNFDQTTSALQNAYEDAKGGTLVMQRVAFAALGTVAVGLYFWLGKKAK